MKLSLLSRCSALPTALAFVTLSPLPRLPAQTIPAPAPAPAASIPAGEERIVLSPFEVTADVDGSYLATNTLAGTRFNTELKDVPASISVMTADFLQDIGALNVADAIEYTVGAERDREGNTGNDVQGQDLPLRMRGFRNSTLSRNFFDSGGASDTFNTERLTFSRGPNSVLFGTGGAGGIADTSSKRAVRKAITSLGLRVGSYDLYRAEVDVNRPVSRTVAVRFNALYQTNLGWRDLESDKRRAFAFAATWRPFQHTTIRVDSEYGLIDQIKPQPWPSIDAVSPWINAGRPLSATFGTVVTGTTRNTTAIPYFIQNTGTLFANMRNSLRTARAAAPAGVLASGVRVFLDESIAPFKSYIAGPGQSSNNDYATTSLFLEQEITKDLFFEFAANTRQVHRDRNKMLNFNFIELCADANAQLPNGTPNPYVGQYYVENGTPAEITRTNQRTDNLRLTGSYAFNAGRLGRHQIAAMVTRRDAFNRTTVRQEAWINNSAVADLSVAANQIRRRTYVAFGGTANPLKLPAYQLSPLDHPVDVNGVKSGYYYTDRNDTLSRLESAVGVLQSKFFDEHLVTTFGYRQDQLENFGNTVTRDALTREITGVTRNGTATSRDKGPTRTLGVIYHALPWLSFNFNRSTNSTPQSEFVVFQANGIAKNESLGPRKGEGLDAGTRFRFLDGRVHGSVSYFETSEKNSQRAQAGNWDVWLKDGYVLLGREPSTVVFNGNDTVDLRAQGWETEWVVNLTRNLKFVVNGSRSRSLGANQFPRVTALANAILPALKALPAATPTPGFSPVSITNAGELVNQFVAQIANNTATEGKPIQHDRTYNGNAFVNYSFDSGRLKGLGLGLGVNSRGPMVVGYNTVTGQPIYDGDTCYLNAHVSYRRAVHLAGHKFNWSVQLSGTNILGRATDLYPTSADENGSYRAYFVTTPTFALTNRFSF